MMAVLASVATCLFIVTRYRGLIYPHSDWDEIIYQALAFKLDLIGLKGYSLQGISLLPVEGKPTEAVFSLGEEGEGNLLRALRLKGLGKAYDERMFFDPPAFPLTLVAASKMARIPLATLCQDVPANCTDLAHWYQAPRAVVPALFSLGTACFVFLLGRRLFGEGAGWVALFLELVSPLDIVFAQKLLPSTMFACLSTATVYFLVCAQEAHQWRTLTAYTVLAGAALGGAFLTQKWAIGLLAPLCVAAAWPRRESSPATRAYVLLTVIALGMLISAGWHTLLWRERGSPLYLPDAPGVTTSKYPHFTTLSWVYYLDLLFRLQPLVLLILVLAPALARDPAKLFLCAWGAAFYATLLVADGLSDYIGKDPAHLVAICPPTFILLGQILCEVFQGRYPLFHGRLFKVAIALTAVGFGLWGMFVGGKVVAERTLFF